ncbi:MAG: Trm112 family protein [Deltaproteobacteria bacterium]|nr:Trm112 family protein [Deltaproteobacteria bacterium]
MNDLQPIENILVCPACRSELDINRDDITCANCKQVYPIYENIPQFAIDENVEAPKKEVAQSSSTM